MPHDPENRTKPGHTPLEDDRLPDVSPEERRRLLTGLLRGVSRAFYLTLRVLPTPLREPVGLAYLLARAADTVADTRLLPPTTRLEHLLSFRKQIEGPASARSLRAIAAALTEKQAIPDERLLLQSLPQAFALLETLPESDRARVRDVVVTLTRGMEMDLRTFPAEDSGRIAALRTPDELDTYTYYVAGCVGEFWTRMLAAHTPALKHWDIAKVSETGVRFGKALQLTNILRDVPKDLRIGRCYLPEDELRKQGLQPDALLEATAGAKARPVLTARLRQALFYFDAARDYTLAIPRHCVRLRLAVLWPILIGLGTLAKLARNDAWLDPAKPSKVTRSWVYRMMLCSVPASLSNGWTSAWIGAWRRRVEEAL